MPRPGGSPRKVLPAPRGAPGSSEKRWIAYIFRTETVSKAAASFRGPARFPFPRPVFRQDGKRERWRANRSKERFPGTGSCAPVHGSPAGPLPGPGPSPGHNDQFDQSKTRENTLNRAHGGYALTASNRGLARVPGCSATRGLRVGGAWNPAALTHPSHCRKNGLSVRNKGFLENKRGEIWHGKARDSVGRAVQGFLG